MTNIPSMKWVVMGLGFVLIGLAQPSNTFAAVSPWLCAKEKWMDSKLQVQRDHTYQIIVKFDGVIDGNAPFSVPVADLNGWPCSWRQIAVLPIALARRRPLEPWFSLIATIDRKKPQRLREGEPFHAQATGRVYCYFNDVPFLYGNNHGRIQLELIPRERARRP